MAWWVNTIIWLNLLENLRYIPKEFSLTLTIEWKLLSKGLYLKGKILVLEITYGNEKYIIECMMGEPEPTIVEHYTHYNTNSSYRRRQL